MTNFDGTQSGVFKTGLNLEVASRIGGVHGLGACGADVVDFLFEKFLRLFGLCQVVNPGTSTAPRGVRQSDHVGAGFSQELARLLGDLLSMAQVTGVVVGCFVLVGDVGWGSPSDFMQPFVDIADLAVPSLGERMPLGVGRKEGREAS